MQADEIEQVVGLTSLLDWSKMQRDSMATMLSSPFDDVGGDVRPASAVGVIGFLNVACVRVRVRGMMMHLVI